MIYFDFIFLRPETKNLVALLEYAKGFHQFHSDYLDKKFVDPLSNVNISALHHWRFYSKLKEIVNFCTQNKMHPEMFWKYAYEIILETGNSTISFNTFCLDWMFEGILRKESENDQIVLAKSYDNYTPMNPYYYIYYKALVKRLDEKYGDESEEKIKSLTNSEKLDIRVFNDFNIIA